MNMSLDKWDKVLYGLVITLVACALVLFLKRYYKAAVLLLSVVVDVIDRVV